MKTTLRTDITVRALCDGFVYNELEEKGLFGMGGQLVIQPEYQRNYIYLEANKEAPVIDSVLKGYPLGLIYFVRNDDGRLEVLDGQQRITSLGRFVTNKFAIRYHDGIEQIFTGLPQDLQDRILDTRLLIYECEGAESEIKEWFQTINIAGIPLKNQEILNAVFSGPFVTSAKTEFSNSNNARVRIWSHYIAGSIKRQDYLETALRWVSHDNISKYMSDHRHSPDIDELRTYFNTVIDWVRSVFIDVVPEMKGRDWARLYETYHSQAYSQTEVHCLVQQLLADDSINDRKGIFEYILGGCSDNRLLDIRIFNNATKRRVYNAQTRLAQAQGISNCPLCAQSTGSNRTRVWQLSEMEADHVTAWSRGGATSEDNCQMLCRTHNRAKGNR